MVNNIVFGVVNIVSKLSSSSGKLPGRAFSVECEALVLAAGAYTNTLRSRG